MHFFASAQVLVICSKDSTKFCYAHWTTALVLLHCYFQEVQFLLIFDDFACFVNQLLNKLLEQEGVV